MSKALPISYPTPRDGWVTSATSTVHGITHTESSLWNTHGLCTHTVHQPSDSISQSISLLCISSSDKSFSPAETQWGHGEATGVLWPSYQMPQAWGLLHVLLVQFHRPEGIWWFSRTTAHRLCRLEYYQQSICDETFFSRTRGCVKFKFKSSKVHRSPTRGLAHAQDWALKDVLECNWQFCSFSFSPQHVYLIP